jgi:hypothetical protein
MNDSSNANSSNAIGAPGGNRMNVPRAIIHKKVLDAAESNPNASMEQLAEQISGASLSIVERVLAEYGDPGTLAGGNEDAESLEKATDEASSGPDAALTIHERGSIEISADSEQGTFEAITDGDGSTPNEEREMKPEPGTEAGNSIDETGEESSPISPSDLTEKQLETMQVIATRPDATQVELGEILGVTSATINQRINAIDGFQWSRRHEFVDDLFEETPAVELEEASSDEDPEPTLTADSIDIPVEIQAESESSANGGSGAAARSSHEALTRFQHDGGENSSDRERPDSSTDAERPCVHEDLARATIDSLEELTDRLVELSRRVETLEQRPERSPSSSAPARADPELTHKIVHACLNADNISESEELQILKTILPSETTEE